MTRPTLSARQRAAAPAVVFAVAFCPLLGWAMAVDGSPADRHRPPVAPTSPTTTETVEPADHEDTVATAPPVEVPGTWPPVVGGTVPSVTSEPPPFAVPSLAAPSSDVVGASLVVFGRCPQ